MPTIFISHATSDDAAVNQIADRLDAGGFAAWVDHRKGGLTPGTPNWERALREAIQGCDLGLLVMSPRSLASDMCSAECLLLRELDKPLYVLRLEACPPEIIWLYIKFIQYADADASLDAGLDSLLAALRGESAGPGAPTALSGRFTGGDVMRTYLPYLKIPLRGREQAVETLRPLLNGGQAVQIIAVGGRGKSRLAAELALAAPRGAVWHRCDAGSAAYEWLELLRQHTGLPKEADQPAILDRLEAQKPLLVLDNAEAVLADDPRRPAYRQLAQALISRGLPLLLTSRRPWTDLKPRQALDLDSLPLPLAQRLALDFAEAAGVPLDAGQGAAIAQAALCHPRLIEFAVEQVLDGRRYERVLKLLEEGRHEDVQEKLDEMVHKSIRDMAAHDKHGPDAEALLKCLCAARGPLDTAAALALKPDGWDDDRAEDALEMLLQWRFVRRETAGRARVDEVVGQAVPADEAARPRLFDHFFALHSDYDRNNDEDNHPLLNAEWENIRAALDWGLKQRPKAACDWLWAVQYFMMLHKSHAERLELLETALETALEAGYTRGQANTLQALGDVHRMKNEYAEAVGRYLAALPLYEAIGARLGQANTLKALGDVAYMQDEYAEAVGRYLAALALGAQIGDFASQLNSLKGLAYTCQAQGDLARACAYAQQLLKLADSHPFFRDHPVVAGWRETFAEWGCDTPSP